MFDRPRLPKSLRSGEDKFLFDAVLFPHRSLGPRGFWIVMSLVALVSFVAGLAFFLIGAWPVLGFFGLDVALIYGAFRMSYHAARLTEVTRLDETNLQVWRISPRGRIQDWSFPAFWVQVRRASSESGGLVISSHGNHVRIGSYLMGDESEALATSLEAALGKLKSIYPGNSGSGAAAPQSP
jgi:uncharacterized membrane protein